jgi:glyoxylase-like metal-dependent hydrolase (beta-lactamase superfamily II)
MTSALNPPDPSVVRISLPTPFPVGPVNVFLIKSDPLILIDAGVKSEEAWRKLVRTLAEHSLAPRDIRLILLTHGHLDHVGLVPRLIGESGAKTYAHPDVVDQYANYDHELEAGQRFYHDVLLEFGAPAGAVDEVMQFRSVFNELGGTFAVDHALADGETVAGFEARYVPGHSASDTLFHSADRRAAFTGDHVLKGISPNPLLRRASRNSNARACSLVEYQRSLRFTRSLDIDTCYPGHGSPFAEHGAVIDGLLERHERRTREVGHLLAEKPMTPYEIVTRIFPKITSHSLHFALSVAIGHLDVLEDRSEVRMENVNGVVVYRLARETTR